MTEARTFPTTAVLTLATGTVMGEWSDAAALVNHYAGGPVWTHQMLFLRDEIEGAARTTLGDGYEPFDPAAEGWEAYRDRIVAKLGETLTVPAPAKPFHREDSVVADAVELMGGDPSRVLTIGVA